jgi:two-component system sensor histidine kinase PilS (NtrC family)
MRCSKVIATSVAENTATQTGSRMPANPPSARSAAHFDIAWRPLRLLTFYRLILAGLLTVLYFAAQESNPFNVQLPRLFASTLLTYLMFSLAIGFATRLHWPAFGLQALLQVFADIAAITLLMHATGGVSSALGVLLVIAVTAGALIAPGRLAYLFAAVATLALLFETGLANLSPEKTGAESVTRAGLLGLVLFAAASLAQVLAARIRESEALAQQRGIDLANLEQLNQHIIRQLQSGIVVIAPDSRIRLANDTARTLLGLDDDSNAALESVAAQLAQELRSWKHDPARQPEAIPSPVTGGTLVPRFRTLSTAQGEGALILLDDSSNLAQQAQQVKLASLGRLTASIAHEIRNPLGAISHAAQLLSESEHLDQGDRRLSDIISKHTQRVDTIIENVLQLSRRNTAQPQSLLLADWLRHFHDDFAQSEHVASDQLRLDTNPEDLAVWFDPGHLQQIMTNLCQNAFRHAGVNPEVLLKARHSEHNVVQLDIIDNGNGIAPEIADQIFEPFYTTATSGTGLGLYIARELCEINQAHLAYQPAPDGGSCFRIRFATEQTG